MVKERNSHDNDCLLCTVPGCGSRASGSDACRLCFRYFSTVDHARFGCVLEYSSGDEYTSGWIDREYYEFWRKLRWLLQSHGRRFSRETDGRLVTAVLHGCGWMSSWCHHSGVLCSCPYDCVR